MFAYAAREHTRLYGTKFSQYACIAQKNRKQGSNNPFACFQRELPSEDVKKWPLTHPITSGMSAMTADGGAAAIVCSETFMHQHGLQSNAVEIVSQKMVTDIPSSFGNSFQNLCGVEMSKIAAQQCFNESEMTIKDVDVLEVHDCFSCNEASEEYRVFLVYGV
jgi:sterol carrier protein 2